ncbi:MAG: FG-GAP repeat protein [candidate division Zixibacteria bacterium]|nr:FG-GAP repeat protein [candidate division Zixibacteria bacterium]
MRRERLLVSAWAGLLSALMFGFTIHSVALGQCPYTQTGEVATGGRFGTQVGPAGDVDGDGYPDFLVATSTLSLLPSEVFVFSGRTNELLQTLAQHRKYHFSSQIAGMGDINNDGFGDILIGTRIFSGIDWQILFALDTVPDTIPVKRFGIALGDVNNDGINDFAMSLPGNSATFTDIGQVSVYSGIDGALLHVLNGDSPGDQFGHRVAPAGDVNGDGFADIIVQTRRWNLSPAMSRISIYSGLDGRELHNFTGGVEDGIPNRGITAVGDVNGDGFDDIAFGFPKLVNEDTYHEIVSVRSGLDGSELLRISGDTNTYGVSYFGAALAGGADIDGDGIPDIVVGAHFFGYSSGARNGAVFVYSGADGSLIGEMFGEENFDQFGKSVAIVGDINLDGRNDILIGAFEYGYPSAGAYPDSYLNTGKTYLFTCLEPCCTIPGDVDNGGDANIGDAIFIVKYIFQDGDTPPCLDQADADGSNDVNIGDATYIVKYIFQGSASPVCGTTGS